MPPTGTPGDFDPAVRRIVAAKVRRLGLRPEDRADLEQDVAARLADRLRTHDPARTPLAAFVALVADQAIANYLRDRCAGKRTPPWPSISADEAPDPMAADDVRLRSLALDVDAVLDRLPADLRALAAALMEATVSQVSRRTGVRRTTLYGRLDELRTAFERCGLQDYV